MGLDKALLPFGGETVLSFITKQYAAVFPEVIISCDAPGRFDTPGFKQVYDNYPGLGPLAGLDAVFSKTGVGEIFLTAVDLPFGSPEIALTMTEMREDRDVCVIRRQSGLLEPLFAVYGRQCAARARAALETGHLSMLSIIDLDKALIIDEAELASLCSRSIDEMLMNINRPEDYEKAVKIIDIADKMQYNGQININLNQ